MTPEEILEKYIEYVNDEIPMIHYDNAIEAMKEYRRGYLPNENEIADELDNSHTIKTDEDEEYETMLTYWYTDAGKHEILNFINWLKNKNDI